MDSNELNKPLGSTTEAVVEATKGEETGKAAGESAGAVETTKKVETETPDVHVTETVTEKSGDSDS